MTPCKVSRFSASMSMPLMRSRLSCVAGAAGRIGTAAAGTRRRQGTRQYRGSGCAGRSVGRGLPAGEGGAFGNGGRCTCGSRAVGPPLPFIRRRRGAGGLPARAARRIVGLAALGQNLRLLDPVLLIDAAAEPERVADAPDVGLHPGRDLLVAANPELVEVGLEVGIDQANSLQVLRRARLRLCGGNDRDAGCRRLPRRLELQDCVRSGLRRLRAALPREADRRGARRLARGERRQTGCAGRCRPAPRR